MAVVAIIVDGKWTPVDDGRPQQVVNPTSDIDQIAAHLGAVVRLAQNMTPEDQRRARDFMHAASAALSATTYLPETDQKLFEAALRDTARKI